MKNLIPLKIQNLQGEIYQVVSTNEETTYYQGSWRQCAEWINEKIIESFHQIISDGILPASKMH